MIRVQNSIQLVQSQLPVEVIEQGISIEARGSSSLARIAFYSPDDSLDDVSINNYVDLNVLPAINRIKGVSSAEILGGGQYSMRIWTDPKAMLLTLILAPVISQRRLKIRMCRPPAEKLARSRFQKTRYSNIP